MSKYEEWVDQVLPKHARLTDTVANTIENLLNTNGVDYLTVSGRTKTKVSTLKKIEEKGYSCPKEQLTDLSGIRIIVYFESDVSRVSEIISDAFNVDEANSLNQDSKLSIDQIGYRSVHYVCDLGDKRAALPEFEGLANLKFEFQVRTVLQHAWAELAHDRNYKFSGKLPSDIERQLYLYAGMLEIADKGFNELSEKIDSYAKDVHEKVKTGNLDYSLDSISLPEFVINWAESNNLYLDSYTLEPDYDDLLKELHALDIFEAQQLKEIIPDNYTEVAYKNTYVATIHGHVRTWLLLNDWRKLWQVTRFPWSISVPNLYPEYFDKEEMSEFASTFRFISDDGDEFYWDEEQNKFIPRFQ